MKIFKWIKAKLFSNGDGYAQTYTRAKKRREDEVLDDLPPRLQAMLAEVEEIERVERETGVVQFDPSIKTKRTPFFCPGYLDLGD